MTIRFSVAPEPSWAWDLYWVWDNIEWERRTLGGYIFVSLLSILLIHPRFHVFSPVVTFQVGHPGIEWGIIPRVCYVGRWCDDSSFYRDGFSLISDSGNSLRSLLSGFFLPLQPFFLGAGSHCPDQTRSQVRNRKVFPRSPTVPPIQTLPLFQ